MNRELIVTLLRKDIQELNMITEGFMELVEYPKPMILLAQRKAEDIQNYISQLADVKSSEIKIEAAVADDLPREVAAIAFEVVPTQEVAEEEVQCATNEPVLDEVTAEVEVELLQIEPDAIPEPEPVVEELPVEIAPEEEPIVEIVNETVAEPIAAIVEPEVKVAVTETVSHSRNEFLAKGVDNSLSSVLANKKITDIKQAMSIGDRFRFQRELFNANGEDMNKTIAYINQLATYQEVESFLKSKYKWAEENETAEDFFQLVRRKF